MYSMAGPRCKRYPAGPISRSERSVTWPAQPVPGADSPPCRLTMHITRRQANKAAVLSLYCLMRCLCRYRYRRCAFCGSRGFLVRVIGGAPSKLGQIPNLQDGNRMARYIVSVAIASWEYYRLPHYSDIKYSLSIRPLNIM
jgi:hypothetical protein